MNYNDVVVGIFRRVPLPDPRKIPRIRTLQLAGLLVAALLLSIVVLQPLGSSQVGSGFVPAEQALKEDAARTAKQPGSLAPGFDGTQLKLVGLDGNPIRLAQQLGLPVWVVFWATTCHACLEEEADLKAAYLAHRDRGLVILAIDFGETPDTVEPYVREHSLPWTVAIDPNGEAAVAYGTIGTPSHFFIDAQGTIRHRAFGRLSRDDMDRLVASIGG